MHKYYYKAGNERGETFTGQVFAASRDEVIAELKEKNYCVYDVKRAFSFSFNWQFSSGSLSLKEMIVFNKQLSILLRSGLPVTDSIDIIRNQTVSAFFKDVLLQISKLIKEGNSLSQALATYPALFSAFYCNSIAAGEKSGSLDNVLERMIKYYTRIMRLRSKIISSIVYPSLLVVVAISLVTFLLVVVIPTFSTIFNDLNAELPFTTSLLLATSGFLKTHVLAILGVAAGLAYFFYMYSKSESGKSLKDTIFLSFPVLGGIYRKYLLSQFSATLGTMLSSGIPMINSLETVVKSVNNSVFSKELKTIVPAVSSGEKLTVSLKRIPTIPDMVIQMISVGEKTGALEDMLASISEYYEEEIDGAVSRMLTLIEPLLMLFMGGVIGFIVISMFLPVIKMSTFLR